MEIKMRKLGCQILILLPQLRGELVLPDRGYTWTALTGAFCSLGRDCWLQFFKNCMSDTNPHFSFFGQKSWSVVPSSCGSCPSSSLSPPCSSLFRAPADTWLCQPRFRINSVLLKTFVLELLSLFQWSCLRLPCVTKSSLAFCVQLRGKLNYCIKIKGFGVYRIVFTS